MKNKKTNLKEEKIDMTIILVLFVIVLFSSLMIKISYLYLVCLMGVGVLSILQTIRYHGYRIEKLLTK